MTVQLKICGITSLEAARYCAAAGADYLGFIQYQGSPRYVDPKTAGAIIEWVYGPEPVGVFVNAPADVVNRTADEAGFRLVQLHGDEPVFVVAEVELPVIKAVRISRATRPDTLRRTLREYEDVVDYFLLDTHSDERWGGTGSYFDWDVARQLASEFEIFVAGGINAANVGEAVRSLGPFGVDVSSSLESSPGTKDLGKIDAFFDAFDALRPHPRAEN